jgi:hypothetical protein
VERSDLDWGVAYEEAMQERVGMLKRQRAEGSRALQRVPGLWQSYCVCDLDDDEIASVAIYEAEHYTNRAINEHRERYGYV